MSSFYFELKTFNPRVASDDEYIAANNFNNQMRAEIFPDDPPIALDEAVRGWKNIPGFVQVFAWGMTQKNDSRLIASANVAFMNLEANRHVAETQIEVLPEFRRQGLGRMLLAEIAATSVRENRRLMIMGTNERIPAGEAFMTRLGARKGLEAHTNQLKIAELDRALVRAWMDRVQSRRSNFELVFLDGDYPEQDLESVSELARVMNTAPHGDLEIGDFEYSPEQLRQNEKAARERGVQRWIIFLRDRANGKLIGFTQVNWHPNRPELLNQAGTGVFPEYRNLGLGRWLKAEMLEKILQDRPQVKFIRTGNADSNAAMLKINYELGFKPYISHAVWQIEVAQVQAYLQAKE
jgi:mycothiol synthase